MRILLATDGSKNAEQAAEMLARLPHSAPLELTILAVIPILELHGSIEVIEWIKENLEAEKAKAKQACQRIEAMFQGANACIDALVVEGHVGKTIIAEAQTRDSDLIVIGAVGHSTLERMILGSTSDFVATHADCSVLIARPQYSAEHSDLKVCVAYDDSESSNYAVSSLGRFEWRRNTQLDVVNFVLNPFTYSEIPIEIDNASIKKEMQQAVARVAQQLRELSPEVQSHVEDADHVGDGLVRFAKEHDSDLIVMGDTGRGLLGRFLLGSVSRYVVRHAECSVWIVRKKQT